MINEDINHTCGKHSPYPVLMAASEPSKSGTSGSNRGASLTGNACLGLHRYGYILGKTLGYGAYAKVKESHSIKQNRQVAVKIVSRKAAPKELIRKFLPREIKALQTVKHDNIVKLYDFIMTEQQIYIVMELAENGDLLDYINMRKRLTEPVAQKFFRELTSAISACHAIKIVHRDLKCENILLDSKYNLKVSDFGFAREYTGGLLETYCGSYAYAAPEVILGNPYNGELSDVWSMGVILYAMVVGRLPFKDNDVKTLLHELARKLIVPSRLSIECKDLIKSILVYSTSDRATLADIESHPWMSKNLQIKESLADFPPLSQESSKHQREARAKSPKPPPKSKSPTGNKLKAFLERMRAGDKDKKHKDDPKSSTD